VFEAQQSAEKALKAVCVFYKIEFPKTHSMTTLTALLEQAGVQLPPEVQEADRSHPMLSRPVTQIGMRLFLTPNIKVL